MFSFYLPITGHHPHTDATLADVDTTTRINDWIRSRYEHAKTVFQTHASQNSAVSQTADAQQIDAVLHTLTHRRFNYQSTSRLGALMAHERSRLEICMRAGLPIPCFFLYHGGYRASPLPEQALIFEPDQTELLLLYQIACLSEDVSKVYPAGIHFFIVINNGVAHWVNDIPLESTQAYAKRFSAMVEAIGACDHVTLLLQSELATFEPNPAWPPVIPSPALSEKDHRLVERFLGRACSPLEARHRHALYDLAEVHWAQILAPLVKAHGGLLLRQVASEHMLSFRPYPGGATRIQNGSLGFEMRAGKPVPQLITTETSRDQTIRRVPWDAPWVSSV